ncbi:MAG: hypothetical protein RIR11_4457 [Bacteroidota bacterium]|jgi:hypothetical protein
MKICTLFTTFCLAILLFSCTKEGQGGNAAIRGYVHASKLSSTFTQLLDQYPAKDQEVFIIYGDRTWGYDDRTNTDFQGRFSFDLLYPGKYRIYTYSRDSSRMDLSGTVAVVRDVEIGGRKEVVTVDTIHIVD